MVNWPDEFVCRSHDSKHKKRKIDRSDDFIWICESCISQLGCDMIRKRVKVWWHDDNVYYEGELNDVDSVTGRYRVLYDDGEWEFISLSQEPVLYSHDS